MTGSPTPPHGAGVASLVETLPFPVAFPLARALDRDLPRDARVKNALFTAYQALRVTSLLLLADYLDRPQVYPRLGPHIARMRRPSFGEWTALTHALVKASLAHPDTCRLPALVAAWRSQWADRGGLEALTPDPDANPLAALWYYRNTVEAHGGMSLEGLLEDDDEVDHVEAALLRMLGHLDVLADHHLLRSAGTGGVFVLRGLSEGGRFPLVQAPAPDLVEAVGATGIALRHGELLLPLSPLFVAGDRDARTSAGLVEPVLMFHGVRARAVVQLGVFRNAPDADLFQPLEDKLARKGVPLRLPREDATAASVAGWANSTSAMRVDAARDVRWWPECYVERQQDELLADAARDAPVLVVGAAGSGKSSMLLRLVDRIVHAAPGDTVGSDAFVVLVEAAELEPSPRGLVEAIARGLGVQSTDWGSAGALLHHVTDPGRMDPGARARRLWLVVDGLDDAPDPRATAREVDELGRLSARLPGLTVVAGARSWLVESLRSGSERNPHFATWKPFPVPDGPPRPWLVLDPFDAPLAQAAYALRARHLPMRSCRTPWEALSGRTRELLRTPLHVQLFHDTFAGRDASGSDLDEAGLYAARLERLFENRPQLRGAVAGLGGVLVETGGMVVPEAAVAPWCNAETEDAIDAALREAPLERLLSEGVLTLVATEDRGRVLEGHGYRFAHARMAEQAMILHLRGLGVPDPRTFRRWVERALHPEAGLFTQPSHLAALVAIARDVVDADPAGMVAMVVGQSWHPPRWWRWVWAYARETTRSELVLTVAALALGWLIPGEASRDAGRLESGWRDLLVAMLAHLGVRLAPGGATPVAMQPSNAGLARGAGLHRLLVAARDAAAELAERDGDEAASALLRWALELAEGALAGTPGWRWVRRGDIQADIARTRLASATLDAKAGHVDEALATVAAARVAGLLPHEVATAEAGIAERAYDAGHPDVAEELSHAVLASLGARPGHHASDLAAARAHALIALVRFQARAFDEGLVALGSFIARIEPLTAVPPPQSSDALEVVQAVTRRLNELGRQRCFTREGWEAVVALWVPFSDRAFGPLKAWLADR